MKRIFLLCSILCCAALSCFATITFNHPNVTSGGTIVWTAVGETPSNHIDAASLSSPMYVITCPGISADNPPPYGTGDGNFSDYFHMGILSVQAYNCTTLAPTTISITCTSTGLVPVNIDINLHFMMKFDVCGGANGTTTTDIAPGATLFPVGQFGNSQRSQAFTRNNCGTGSTGSSVTYTVIQNTYAGSTQAAADAQAQTDINNNGQNYANSHGTCTVNPPTISFAVTNNSGNGLSITFVRTGQSNISVNAPAHSGTQHVTLPQGSGYYIGYNPSGMPVNCTVSLSNGESHPNAPGGNFSPETIGTGAVISMTAN
ncbi:DUF5977 domain-containing protein [Mucilaginibacter sp.]|uniref:DUF5977 domain-containing protein n=1 Tax=Mucilaginibacter sp. TaxID=1882438 RepID=UPI0025FB5C92|nr:DUF5977 domain-containing protein [Mucilaginibacter sp.]